MQFRLLQLMAVLTGLSILFGLAFAAPLPIAMSTLSVLLLLPPPIWVIGTIYGRGATRAMSIGSLASGAIVWLFAVYEIYFT